MLLKKVSYRTNGNPGITEEDGALFNGSSGHPKRHHESQNSTIILFKQDVSPTFNSFGHNKIISSWLTFVLNI